MRSNELNTYFESKLPDLDKETIKLLELYHFYRKLQERDEKECLRREEFRMSYEGDFLERIGAPLQSQSNEWIGWIPFFRNHSLGDFKLIAEGEKQWAVFPLKAFIRDLLGVNPAGFYLFHNHPSQDLTPSQPDLKLTRSLRSLVKQLEIPLFGHGIIGVRRVHWIVLQYPSNENRITESRLREVRKTTRSVYL